MKCIYSFPIYIFQISEMSRTKSQTKYICQNKNNKNICVKCIIKKEQKKKTEKILDENIYYKNNNESDCKC